jgi:hypothetical protein
MCPLGPYDRCWRLKGQNALNQSQLICTHFYINVETWTMLVRSNYTKQKFNMTGPWELNWGIQDYVHVSRMGVESWNDRGWANQTCWEEALVPWTHQLSPQSFELALFSVVKQSHIEHRQGDSSLFWSASSLPCTPGSCGMNLRTSKMMHNSWRKLTKVWNKPFGQLWELWLINQSHTYI